MSDQPAAGPPNAVPSDPSAAAPPRPPDASGLLPGAPGNVAAQPGTLRTVLLAVAATVVVMSAAATGYRFYADQQVEAAADAVRARAYAEASVQSGARAAAKPAIKPATKSAKAVGKRPAGVAPVDVAAADASAKPATRTKRKAATAKPRPAAKRVASSAAPAKHAARQQPTGVSALPPCRPSAEDRFAGRLPRAQSVDVDDIYQEQVARECATGFLGAICREWLRASLCFKHDAFGKAAACPRPAFVAAGVG